MNSDSHFAPAERSDRDKLEKDIGLLKEEKTLLDILGSISGLTAVLNENRQIIYANDEFIRTIGVDSLELVLGKRVGESVSCIHSASSPSGCGTTEACSVCGAVNAIMDSQKRGMKSVREARITSDRNNELLSWDLQVTSAPVTLHGKQFYIFSVTDVSSEKRRLNLERIFLHDILNSAGNLSGLISMLKEGVDEEQAKKILNLSEEVSRDMIEEIQSHRQIRSAENGDLVPNIEVLVAAEVLESAVMKISRNESAKGKRIISADHSVDCEIKSDRIILQRVLINMLKNAVEATMPGGIVYADISEEGNYLRYRIRNEGVIQNDIKLQIFQRSFSTKEKGRGIGTYSIKLLTERYLKGRAGFVSNESDGTVFYIDVPREIKS